MWVILVAMILVPGLCLATWVFQRQTAFLLATPLSLLIYVGISLSFYLADRTSWIPGAYIAAALAIIVITLVRPHFRTKLYQTLVDAKQLLPLLLIFLVYNAAAGAFIDFGNDVYQHMVFVQQAMESIRDTGALKMKLALGNLNFVFHNIAAIFAVSFNIDAPQLIGVLSVAYALLWTISVYYFCFLVFKQITTNRKQVILLAYLSVFFYWTTFGINNFSFPRSYYGGPAILNYCVYLAALWLSLKQFMEGICLGECLVIIALVCLAGILHEQEALMLAIFVMGLSVVIVMLKIFGVRTSQDVPINGINTGISLLVLLGCGIAVLLLIYLLPKYRFDPIPLLNLGVLSEGLVGWNILRPDHQFYTVLGLWGLYVYAIAFVYIRQVGRNLIFLVTLVLPIITVFNPIFVEAFSKLAYPQVLWRTLFALQLPILASYIVGYVALNWRSGNARGVKLFQLMTILPLFGLLLPFQFGVFNNTMTKIPSLVKTPSANSYLQWQDLIDYLNGLEEKNRVLTDPVTGYAVRSLTNQHHGGYKFFPTNFIQFNFEHYDDKPLEKYKNSLLVVNLRNGEINTRLQPPHHIYPDIMKVDKYYGLPLIEELENNSEKYPVLWSQNEISVYRIQ